MCLLSMTLCVIVDMRCEIRSMSGSMGMCGVSG